MIKTYKTKKAGDLSCLFLILWGIGELAMVVYILNTTQDPVLLVQYFVNLIFLLVILRYKIGA